MLPVSKLTSVKKETCTVYPPVGEHNSDDFRKNSFYRISDASMVGGVPIGVVANELSRSPIVTRTSIISGNDIQSRQRSRTSLTLRHESKSTRNCSAESKLSKRLSVSKCAVLKPRTALHHIPLLRQRGGGNDFEADNSNCSSDITEDADAAHEETEQHAFHAALHSKRAESSESEQKVSKTLDSKSASRNKGPPQPKEIVDEDATRAEFLRKRNAFYSRRKYARKKIEIEVLKEQCREAKKKNDTLVTEEERLKSLLAMAKEVVNIHTTRGPDALLGGSPSLSAVPLMVNSTRSNELSRPAHQAFCESNIALVSALGRQQMIQQGLLPPQPSIQAPFGSESLLESLAPRLSDAAFFGALQADPRHASAQTNSSLFLGAPPSYIFDNRAAFPPPGPAILLGDTNWNIDPALRTQQLQYVAVPREAMRTSQNGDSGSLGNLGFLVAQQAPLPPHVAYDPSSLLRQNETLHGMQGNRLLQRSQAGGKKPHGSIRPSDGRGGLQHGIVGNRDHNEVPHQLSGQKRQHLNTFGVTDHFIHRTHTEDANSSGSARTWHSPSALTGGTIRSESVIGGVNSSTRVTAKFHRGEDWSEKLPATPVSNSRQLPAEEIDSGECSTSSDESQPVLKRKRDE